MLDGLILQVRTQACLEGTSELSKVRGSTRLEPRSPVSGPAYIILCHPTTLVSVLCHLRHLWGEVTPMVTRVTMGV